MDRLIYAYHLYDFYANFGRLLPFIKLDALLIFYLHDLEKPWRIKVMPDGTVNCPGFATKEAFQFLEDKLVKYGESNRSEGQCFLAGSNC